MYFRLMGKLNARRKGLLEQDEKGFTLIELLVVVIIIGILAAIAIPVYLGIQNNAKDSAVKSDVSNAKTAVVAYQTSNNGKLPTDLSNLSAFGYTAPGTTNGNYGTAPVLSQSTDGTAFCVAAVSVTKATFAASDTTGVTTGTCGTDGKITTP